MIIPNKHICLNLLVNFFVFYNIHKRLLVQPHWTSTTLIPMRDAYLYGACVSLSQQLGHGIRVPPLSNSQT